MNTGTSCNFPGTLDMKGLPIVRIHLNALPLSQIIDAILPELSKNFERVSAEVIQCPDLTQPPFNLASEGLSGDENVFDIGDIVNIMPEIKREKLYDVKDLKQIVASDPLFVIGACAGPYPFLEVDSECVMNVKMAGNCVKNGSIVIAMSEVTGESIDTSLPNEETRFSILGNLFTSKGLKGEVLKIVCEVRKGPLNFLMSVKEALAKNFGHEIIALGGVVLIENGKVKVHVIKPSLTKTPLKSENDLSDWLQFVELSPPSVAVGSIVSHDHDLNLRQHHFHQYCPDRGQGGHYHYDTEPETIKYTGYFSVAKQLIKIDQTEVTAPKHGSFF